MCSCIETCIFQVHVWDAIGLCLRLALSCRFFCATPSTVLLCLSTASTLAPCAMSSCSMPRWPFAPVQWAAVLWSPCTCARTCRRVRVHQRAHVIKRSGKRINSLLH